MKNVLIFGGTGFVGQHLKRASPAGFIVTAVGRGTNITNKKKISEIIKLLNPSIVINLASITTVKDSFNNPSLCYSVTITGMVNLLEVLVENHFKGILLYASSSEVYGHPDSHELPFFESKSPLKPNSPYSLAKISAEIVSKYYIKNFGLKIIIARPFTHIGPGQSDKFSISNFASQIAQIYLGLNDPIITVGNLNTSRDLTDVRDVARAYWNLVDKGKVGEIYNICSGVERNIGDVLNELIYISGLKIKIYHDSLNYRINDQPRIKGSFNKIANDIGWKPEIKLSTTLSDLLKYWIDDKSLKYRIN